MRKVSDKVLYRAPPATTSKEAQKRPSLTEATRPGDGASVQYDLDKRARAIDKCPAVDTMKKLRAKKTFDSLPIELWGIILSHAKPNPLWLIDVATHFGKKYSTGRTLASAAHDRPLMASFAHPSDETTSEHENQTLLVKFERRFTAAKSGRVQKCIRQEYAKENHKNHTLPRPSHPCWSDFDYVRAAVQTRSDSLLLYFASSELGEERKIVKQAIRNNSIAFLFASPELQNDREICLEAVSRSGSILGHFGAEKRKDREIVLRAVKKDGNALMFADGSLRSDFEVVMAAVTQNGAALRHASDDMRRNIEIVLTAAQQCGWALEHVNGDMRANIDVVRSAVNQNGLCLRHAHHTLRNNKDIVLAAVQENGLALGFASYDLKRDRSIVLAAIQTIVYASEALQADEAIYIEASQHLVFDQAHQDRCFMERRH